MNIKFLIPMKKPHHSFYLLLFIIIASCEPNLDVGLPNSQLTNHTIFQNTSTTRAAIADIYSDLRTGPPFIGNSGGLGVLLGLYADDLDLHAAGRPSEESFYVHNINSFNQSIADWWQGSYQSIYKCNSIIEGLKDSPIPENEKKSFLGEVLFLRAFFHFNLTKLFGDIPIINSTDYTLNSNKNRDSTIDVIDFILNDLILAQEIIASLDDSGKFIYATKGVVQALLANIYLYQKKWQDAVIITSEVIDNSPHSLINDISQVFVSSSSEIIWQIPPTLGSSTWEAQTYILDTTPPSLVALTNEFIFSFEPQDLRLTHWINSVSDGDQTWYYPYKYKTKFLGDGPEEFSVMFRLGEIFLIRAEANANLNNLELAKEDLNKIRNRAGLEPVTSNNRTEILSKIYEERRHELFTEKGERWFDLKRTGLAQETLHPIKINYKPTDSLFPIPAEEIILNPSLKPQNPGY